MEGDLSFPTQFIVKRRQLSYILCPRDDSLLSHGTGPGACSSSSALKDGIPDDEYHLQAAGSLQRSTAQRYLSLGERASELSSIRECRSRGRCRSEPHGPVKVKLSPGNKERRWSALCWEEGKGREGREGITRCADESRARRLGLAMAWPGGLFDVVYQRITAIEFRAYALARLLSGGW